MCFKQVNYIQHKLNLLNACILYFIIVFIIRYIAISLSIYKNILLCDKFNFIDQFICSDVLIFQHTTSPVTIGTGLPNEFLTSS